MLKQVAEGVLVHESDFVQSNTTVVRGPHGVLLIDPGIRDGELTCLADDLAELGETITVAFSTHPHWDHLLWHPRLGKAPRYGMEACAATVREELSDPGAKAEIIAHLEPTGIADQVSLDQYGLISPLSESRIPWEGPEARLVEHRAHAPGHAALFIEERGVLVAGDMLSDVLVPMLDWHGTTDPIGDYLTALRLLEDVADGVDVVIPGHGSVGGPGQVRTRVDRDRAYLIALRDGDTVTDPRIGPSARPGWEWVSDVHEGQAERAAAWRERGTSG